LKFYDSLGPNPRLVRMFMSEKGIEIPSEQVDILAGENRQEPFLRVNPSGQMPALEIDGGTCLAETVVICEYLEEKHPEPALIGRTPEERALTRMWTRRVEWKIIQPLTDGFRFGEGLSMFKDRIHVIPQAADDLKAIAREGSLWLDAQLEGRTWIAGERFSLADIVLYAFLDFGTGVGQPRDPALKRLGLWFERVNARPSAEASLHPIAKSGGMRA
jgi:glutathione S-transferase